MPGSGGALPNPDDDNDSLVSVTDSEEEHERQVSVFIRDGGWRYEMADGA